MKITIKKSLLVALMFGTLICYANDKNVAIINLDAERVMIEFKSVKKGQILAIKDVDGITIYNQEIKNSGDYSKLFNLTALKNGKYTAELDKDFEVLIKTFKVEDNFVSFLTKENKKVYKPVIRNKENLILISKINFENEPLKVFLYYKEEVIFSKIVTGKQILNRIYKLSESEKGDYKVIIYSNNRIYFKEFTI
jgi:hypothetical protein